MSEELKKMSLFELFEQNQQTFEEAEEKAKQESSTPRVDRFRIGEDGEYTLRVLPLAPTLDAEGNVLPMERKGYEYPLHQQFLAITLPSKKGGKQKKINIPVVRTTDKGVDMSIDLIDTYVKIAKEMYGDDDELMELINSGGYYGGLKWNYQHAMYVLDLSSDKERAKGPQLWQCSHSQYKSIDDAKMRLWRELRADGEQPTCPISGLTDAYPINVIRTTDKKTEYTIEIGRKVNNLKESEVEKLLSIPRINEQIYRYTRYQLEATIEFLKQYDEKYDMEVCKETDFQDAIKTLSGELSAEDTSHFDIVNLSTNDKSEKSDEVTINSLWTEYDFIVDNEMSEKSDEYQDLREKIRQFIETNQLDVRISRAKNNKQLLEEVEEALESESNQSKKADSAPQEDTKEESKDDEQQEEENPAEEEAPVTPRARRPRPMADADAEESNAAEATDTSEEPVTRRRRLR